MAENRKKIDVTYVENESQSFYRLFDETFTVIRLRSDAQGGYGSTKTDPKSAVWEAPDDQKITAFEAKDLDHGGDYRHEVYLVEDKAIHATTWAKGHARGEAHNHSWIEIEIIVTVAPRSSLL
ncbi:hypothetical protein [Paenibacillus sp. USHLN196]|uniref:hypothetical protein n=1 Tax=Paenibacillus sp. USHLN196 TaxID=3081291 RepID=UPI00301981D5